MEHQISPFLIVREKKKTRTNLLTKFSLWAAATCGLDFTEAVCCFLYKSRVDDGNGLPEYSISYQELLLNAREGFEKLRQYKESTINL